MSSLTKIPAGVQYFFDDEARLRRYVERCALNAFDGWSYDEIILPMFDYHDLFARGMGTEKAERTYRFVDQDGALLALRPELTSLVARTVATRFKNKPRPLRICYSGEVFRYDEPTERSAREFHQLGIEHIGQRVVMADLEILLVAAELLTTLGLGDFRIVLSHVDFFNGVAEYLRLEEADRAQLRELIDHRNNLGLAQYLGRVAPQIEPARREAFCRLTRIAGKDDAIPLARQGLINERSGAAIEQIAEIYTTLTQLGLRENFDIDLGDAGGLEYYTGLTFKIYVPGCGAEIGSGGRYDNLIGNFGAPEPAVGFSISLDGLAGARSRQMPESPCPGRESAEPIRLDGDRARVFSEVRELRRQNRKVKIGEK
ncbi:MAG TPA: ATP phosphoribosyltransferase regulatory subunit [Blastocatellia bacterium]|nr:ATP phosphoribosyltransferase regulatory subunit [Blastocatellia bacterium]